MVLSAHAEKGMFANRNNKTTIRAVNRCGQSPAPVRELNFSFSEYIIIRLADVPIIYRRYNVIGEIYLYKVSGNISYIAGLDELTDEQIERGDFDGDEEITMKDVLRARRIIAGLD